LAVYVQKGISEAGGSEGVDLRAKEPVPAANIWFYFKPTNSLSDLFTSPYVRHAALKKYPWAVALLVSKPYLCLKNDPIFEYFHESNRSGIFINILCEVGLQI